MANKVKSILTSKLTQAQLIQAGMSVSDAKYFAKQIQTENVNAVLKIYDESVDAFYLCFIDAFDEDISHSDTFLKIIVDKEDVLKNISTFIPSGVVEVKGKCDVQVLSFRVLAELSTASKLELISEMIGIKGRCLETLNEKYDLSATAKKGHSNAN